MTEEKNTAEEKSLVIKVDLNAQAREILERATAKGVEHSFMFVTAFKRYQELISHLQKLQESIKEDGMLVKKEYVKGRANIYVNPAVNAYNATSAAADRTAQLLMRYIVQPLKDENEDDGDAFDVF
jgi:hypothetical protein